MGAWSVSITGNDTAQDLKSEYQAAFYYNDVETALAKIEAYAHETFDEADAEQWCDYFYSLADFMWRHGILTDSVRDRALEMIDTGFGLALWEEAGVQTLEKRKEVLREFREKLLSGQPPKKKVRIGLNLSPVFETGDLVAIGLRTADRAWWLKHCFSEEQFRSCHGKYVVLRKVKDQISYTSRIEPRVKDYWAVFQLYKAVFDVCPTADMLRDIPWADTGIHENGMFVCESNMHYFKQRNCRVIGKNMADIDDSPRGYRLQISLQGYNNPYNAADETLLEAIFNPS